MTAASDILPQTALRANTYTNNATKPSFCIATSTTANHQPFVTTDDSINLTLLLTSLGHHQGLPAPS